MICNLPLLKVSCIVSKSNSATVMYCWLSPIVSLIYLMKLEFTCNGRNVLWTLKNFKIYLISTSLDYFSLIFVSKFRINITARVQNDFSHFLCVQSLDENLFVNGIFEHNDHETVDFHLSIINETWWWYARLATLLEPSKSVKRAWFMSL